MDARERDSQALRYAEQSARYLRHAQVNVRTGRWERAVELLWGSLVVALKAVAARRGRTLRDQGEAQAYAAVLGRELGDSQVPVALARVAWLQEETDTVEDLRPVLDTMYPVAEEVMAVVQRLHRLAAPAPRPPAAPAREGGRGRRPRRRPRWGEDEE